MISDILDTIDMRELGQKLQQARIKRGMTLDDMPKNVNTHMKTPEQMVFSPRFHHWKRRRVEELVVATLIIRSQIK